ncbi:MAG: M12 family metallo-peptidase, partial [Acidobacteriota bacterium]
MPRPQSFFSFILAAALVLPATAFAHGSAHGVAEKVSAAQSVGAHFVPVHLFDGAESLEAAPTKSERRALAEVLAASDMLSSATVMELRPDALHALRAQAPTEIALALPFHKAPSGALTLDLVQVEILAPAFKVSTANPVSDSSYDFGVHYQGVVRGESDSVAAISVYGDEITGFVGSKSFGHIALGALEQSPEKRARGDRRDYIVYAEDDLLSGDHSFTCQFQQDRRGETLAPFHTSPTHKAVEVPTADVFESKTYPDAVKAAGDCVNLYFEADFTLFQARGGVAATIAWVTSIFNQVSAAFAIDNIEVGLSEVFVWNTPSPYNSFDAGFDLDTFIATRRSYNGNLGQLLKISNDVGAGVAAGLDGLCTTTADSMSVSYIENRFAPLPTHSETIAVIVHEFGHSLGSPHTHGCDWNGNNTAIDGCAAPEGFCPQPADQSVGTVMSYCPTYDWTEVFHPQPAQLLRNNIASASCLQANCSGSGGGGGGGGGG